MNSTLPEQLKAAADALLEGVSRKDLALRSAAITAHYRGGQGSRAAITGKQDALAYLVARLPARLRERSRSSAKPSTGLPPSLPPVKL